MLNDLVKNPLVVFVALPIAVGYVFSKSSNGLFGIFDKKEQLSPMAGPAIRKEGGSPDDFMFRATSSSRPAGPGTRVGDEIQPLSTQGRVRYDREYHDTVFLPNLNYQDNKDIYTIPTAPRVKDTYVFAGISGLNKINMR
jgi:hypothetical protein